MLTYLWKYHRSGFVFAAMMVVLAFYVAITATWIHRYRAGYDSARLESVTSQCYQEIKKAEEEGIAYGKSLCRNAIEQTAQQ